MDNDHWTKVPNQNIGEHADMFVISSENVTVSKFEFREPTNLSAHYHSNEQTTIVIEGEMRIQYGTEKKIMRAGDVCIIPSNVIHSAQILKVPFRSYDIFYPVRADFIQSIQ